MNIPGLFKEWQSILQNKLAVVKSPKAVPPATDPGRQVHPQLKATVPKYEGKVTVMETGRASRQG